MRTLSLCVLIAFFSYMHGYLERLGDDKTGGTISVLERRTTISELGKGRILMPKRRMIATPRMSMASARVVDLAKLTEACIVSLGNDITGNWIFY